MLRTFVIVTTVKYVAVAMSIDNNGEGGILSLMALAGKKQRKHQLFMGYSLPTIDMQDGRA